jgi:hypothetical protein
MNDKDAGQLSVVLRGTGATEWQPERTARLTRTGQSLRVSWQRNEGRDALGIKRRKLAAGARNTTSRSKKRMVASGRGGCGFLSGVSRR